MLNDREREALRELERQVKAEDPKFVSSFDARMQGAGSRLRTALTATAIAIAAMAGALVMLVTGSFSVLLAPAVVAVSCWVCWLLIKRSRDTQDPPS